MNPKYLGTTRLDGPPFERKSIKDTVLSYPRTKLEDPPAEPKKKKKTKKKKGEE